MPTTALFYKQWDWDVHCCCVNSACLWILNICIRILNLFQSFMKLLVLGLWPTFPQTFMKIGGLLFEIFWQQTNKTNKQTNKQTNKHKCKHNLLAEVIIGSLDNLPSIIPWIHNSFIIPLYSFKLAFGAVYNSKEFYTRSRFERLI